MGVFGIFEFVLPVRFRAPAAWIVLALVAYSGAWGQRYTFRQYDSADGLTDMSVLSLFQDRAGYIWVGTENGLFRYDGSRFLAFNHADGLPNSAIRSLAESPDGVLWVATQGGVARRRGNRFETVNTGTTGLFRSVAFDGTGRMYLRNSSGIVRGVPDGKGSYRFEMAAAGAVQGLAVGAEEAWFSRDGEVWRLKDNITERVGGGTGLLAGQGIYMAYDARGGLWVQGTNRLYELPRGGARFVNRSAQVPAVTYNGLYADSHGRIFVTHDNGVTMLDGDERTVVIDERHGLPWNGVSAVLLDREGSLWLGTGGGGLIRRLGTGDWLSWKKQDGLLSDTVWAIGPASGGRTWVGSRSGLNLLDAKGKVTRSWTSHNGLAAYEVLAVAEGPAGDLFAGTHPGGISHFSQRGELLKTYTASSGFTNNAVVALSVDTSDRLWVASFRGCFRSRLPLGAGSLSFESVEIPGLGPGTLFFDLVADKSGNVWIATSSGLVRYTGNQWRLFAERDGIKPGGVSVIALGTGALWLAYRDSLGVTRIEFDGERMKATDITMRDGLASDKVYAIAEDAAERLWITSDVGVDVREGGRWRHYDREDGLIWNDTDGLALDADAKGQMWVGTSAGLSRWSPPRYPVPSTPVPVAITLIASGKGKTLSRWEVGDRPTLAFAQRSLLLNYTALSYASESRVRFRYRILGYDAGWTDTRERSVHFEGLPAGHYIFQVSATGGNGLWSAKPAEFAFSITPPWWQTWWFVTVCVLAAGFLITALWRVRVRVLVAQRKQLEKLVADRTAELTDSNRQLEEIAYCDQLTALPNRRMFNERFRARLEMGRRAQDRFALILIDLDRFKQINDTFGHDAGDAVLIETANRLRAIVRESDCVARLGGDEFAILPFASYDSADIEEICKRIVNCLAVGITSNGRELKVGSSVGVAIFPDDGHDQTTLYKASDLALYEAKQSRSTYSFRAGSAAARSLNG